MLNFGPEDDGKTIIFYVAGETRHGILTFISSHPYLIDEDGRLWLFHANGDVFRVDHIEEGT
jgi:hypothetical protein